MVQHGYCIFTDTLFQGRVPVERDEDGKWVIYETEEQAILEIEADEEEWRRQYLAGERELEDGIESEDAVCEVKCLKDGSIVDEWGHVFSPSL